MVLRDFSGHAYLRRDVVRSPEMAVFNVPPQYVAPLKAFAALPPRTAGRLAKAVEELAPFTPMPRIVAAFRKALPKTAKDVRPLLVITALTSLVAERGDRALEKLAEDLASSPDLEIERERQAAVARVFARLLKAPAVVNFGKADDVITDHARVFSRARILTDIRPVFESDASETPSAAVIVEMLHIDFWNREGAGGSFYVALDHADLIKLKAVIDRGLRKTETLKNVLRSAGLTYYEHQEVPNAERPAGE